MKLTVGVLGYHLAGSYEGPMVSAVARATSQAGCRLIAIRTAGLPRAGGPGSGVSLKDLAGVGWDLVDGFIAMPNGADIDYLQALHNRGKPVVTIALGDVGFPCQNVVADNAGGVCQAVEHLLAHGHRRIAFVGWMEQFDIRARYAAYRDTLRKHGIEPEPGLVYEAGGNYEEGAMTAARQMLADGLPSTAVIAATDLNAIAIMKALRDGGCALPDDQAIIGFDDNPDSALLTPSLSSVSQHPERIASTAAALLLRQLRGEAVAPGPYVVETSFVARKSCGCDNGEGYAAAISPDEGAVEVFARRMAPSSQATGHDQDEVASLAAQLGDIYRRALDEEPSEAELSRLGQLCEDLYNQDPSQITYNAIMALTTQLRASLGPAASPTPTRGLAQCAAQVQLSLTTAVLEAHNNDYYKLRKFVRDEYEITAGLLKEEDPGSLHWLRGTDAERGVLALWRDDDSHAAGVSGGLERSHPPLDVVGTFGLAESGTRLESATCAAEMFPPEDLVAASAGQDCVTFIFPLRGEERDWGFLAISQAISSRLGQEAYFMWSELLGQVLDHKTMAKEVRESEERYALASRATSDGLWDWDINKGSIYYSFRWKQMLGYSHAEIGNGPDEWLRRVHPEDRPALEGELSALKRGECSSVLNEHRVQARDGRYLWMLCRGLGVPGPGHGATRLVGSLADVTERRSLEDRLRQQALYDSLTGLANRTLFLERLSLAVQRAHESAEYTYTVVWLDLDNFKHLNDELGHLYGDQLLAQVAQRIRQHIRKTDTAARFGGDEFALLVDDADGTTSLDTVVRRLSEHLNEPYDLNGYTAIVTASLGIARGTARYERPEEILRDADIAMYRAKAKRCGAYVTFDASMSVGDARSGIIRDHHKDSAPPDLSQAGGRGKGQPDRRERGRPPGANA